MPEKDPAEFTPEDLERNFNYGLTILRLRTGDVAKISRNVEGHFAVRFFNPDGSRHHDNTDDYYTAKRIAAQIARWHQHRDPEGTIMGERRVDDATRYLTEFYFKRHLAFLRDASL